jgi:hypothetical protein
MLGFVLNYRPRTETCIQCGRPYLKTHVSQRTCGPDCREKRALLQAKRRAKRSKKPRGFATPRRRI